MAGKNFAFKVMHKEMGVKAEVITLENASSLNIYQLRQELTRRGIFDEIFGKDGEKRSIGFEPCLEVGLYVASLLSGRLCMLVCHLQTGLLTRISFATGAYRRACQRKGSG